ncbi:hypothetical protein RclHR1_00570026 [Rhizophagus clarus]|nr:hypothetical protein RclHR1_00570026 [Rhizophagus clarus]
MAFRSLMKNLLSQRYPLIFSPNYQEKLQSITKYIPTISNSIARIINNSPNEEFRSKTNKLVQETRDRVNLSFALHQDIKGHNITSKEIRNILENGLYTIAKDINVPTPSFVEHSSSDEEVLDNRIEERDADLKQKTKITHDVPESDFDISYQTNNMDYDLFVNLESEVNESLFDNDDMNIIEKALDVDDVESMFEEYDEDYQNLAKEELGQSSSSENYENFWDEEDIQFLFGIKDIPTKTITMNTCSEYITKSSQKDNLDNDIDLLDYDSTDEEDMHDIDSDFPPNEEHDSNNWNVMLPHSRLISPFRDKMSDLFQGQEIHDFSSFQKSQCFLNEKNQDSEDTFFDTMF